MNEDGLPSPFSSVFLTYKSEKKSAKERSNNYRFYPHQANFGSHHLHGRDCSTTSWSRTSFFRGETRKSRMTVFAPIVPGGQESKEALPKKASEAR
ncbi:hypothetical protein P4479_04815 [Brevibacillus agri]|uniref:hypothetical protein n=1 Tax=Brevibacillus agri TaxID=51101 RepID=UPI001013D455|nr:hypothetical protein [Brevibacillus agri]MED3497780.1 hypothetical protein [Brevibacillus agri]